MEGATAVIVVSTSESDHGIDTPSATKLEDDEQQPQQQPTAADDTVVDGEDEKKESTIVTTVTPELTEEEKLKYANWPYRDIKEPHANDVLYGRGGGTNHHVGNKRYRKMVEDRKIDYVNCKRLDKPLVALSIIRDWRSQTPTGRFLKMDEKTGLWNDVGDRKAREKTSQALREKAPQIREELEKDRIARERRERGESSEDDDDDVDDDPIKSTRFANGTNLGGSTSNKKPDVVTRDHSLGREYLDPADNMSVEGFSWQDPVRSSSSDVFPIERIGSFGVPPPPVYGGMPVSRMGSYSSVGPPPQPPYDHSMGVPPPDLHARYASWNRYESWGSLGPIPPPHTQQHAPPPPHMGYGPYPTQSGGWTARDHSLGGIPLQHANVSQAAYPTTFDQHQRVGSSGPYWGPPLPPHHHHPHHPHHPPPPYPIPPPMTSGGPPMYHVSGSGYPPPYSGGPPPPPSRSQGPPPSLTKASASNNKNANGAVSKTPKVTTPQPPLSPKSPTYNVDPKVASQWSGRDQNEIVQTMSGSSCEEQHDTFVAPPIYISPSSKSANGTTTNLSRSNKIGTGAHSGLKPDLIKRATSNQNETFESKPDFDGKCVKRAALNRDSSLVANTLKARYMPEYFDSRTEVELLRSNLEQSTLEPTIPSKPSQLSNQDRMMTLDMAALDLVIKPTMLRMTSRSTTIEALNIDFDDDNNIDFSKIDPFATPSSPAITEYDRDVSAIDDDIFNDSRLPPSRPYALRASQRLTTTDLIDIVNEPLSDD